MKTLLFAARLRACLSAACICLTITALAQDTKPVAPTVLPGKGLKQFDFMYAGEAPDRNLYIVKGGQIVWHFNDSTARGEVSDAVLMANGNILYAHQYGIKLINKDKKVLWQYNAPEGCETHTAQLIGTDHVVFVQNGNPAKVFVIDIKKDSIEKQFNIPFKSGTHGQIRHARLSSKGTLLIAHMDLGKINEYDTEGNILSSLDAPGAWSATPLKNGNLLVCSNQNTVKELTRNGYVVWEVSGKDIPGYQITNPQLAQRLPNGNTLINNWFNSWEKKMDKTNPPVQAIEMTPDKKIVWALRSWELGPSTTIQLLNDPNNMTGKVTFGEFK